MEKLFFALIIGLFAIQCSKESSENKHNIENVPAGNCLKGNVEVYASNDKPIKIRDATVELLDYKKVVVKSIVANENGTYVFDSIPKGTFSVFVRKDGYYNHGYYSVSEMERATKKYSFSTNDSTIMADAYTIYKKSTARIKNIKWYQGYIGAIKDGVHLDATFEGLDIPQGQDYVYLYAFAGYDNKVSKNNFAKEIKTQNGSTTRGYVKMSLYAEKIKNGKIMGYRSPQFCSWVGGTLNNAEKYPTYFAFYMTSTIGTADYFIECGEEYSGISNEGIVVKW